MAKANIVLSGCILIIFNFVVPSVNGYMTDFPGPYCAKRPGGCCDSRKDECAVPISSKIFTYKCLNFILWIAVIRCYLTVTRRTVTD